VERRQTPTANLISDMPSSSKRRFLRATSHIWGGALLDLSLVTIALLLVMVLGLYPSPPAPTKSAVVDAAQIQKNARQQSPLVAARRPVNRPPTAEDGQSHTTTPKDKYASVRDAWGG
jgi:hypothetical protein